MAATKTRAYGADECAKMFAADFSPRDIVYAEAQNNQYASLGLVEHAKAAALHETVAATMIQGNNLHSVGLETAAYESVTMNAPTMAIPVAGKLDGMLGETKPQGLPLGVTQQARPTMGFAKNDGAKLQA